jgi:hypothetical protein
LFLAGAFLRAQDIEPAVAAIANAASPNPPAPLEGKDRLQIYLKSLVTPTSIFSNVLIAGMEEARNFPKEWGRTGSAFGQRLGSQYAQFFLDNTIEAGVSAVLHEDNRYVRIGQGNFFKRFGNVLKSTVVVASTNGGHTLAFGQIAGAYGSWAIASQVWEPPSEQKGSRILLWGSVNLASKGSRNLFKEFGPDIRRKLHPTKVPASTAAPAHP